ncbi:glycosyltransferase [Pelagibacterales bacterium SAG-MED01]|nr:glycosyltransferase [Pelagibacterales bacterium SAG-MED01]
MRYQKKKIDKKIVIFIPSIERGGVEKNLFFLINYLKKFYSNIYLVTSSKVSLNKNIKIIKPKSTFWFNKSRLLKSIICTIILLRFFKRNEALIISFQSNVFSIILSKIMSWPVVIRLNTAPDKYIDNFFKFFLYKILYSLPNQIIVNSLEFKKIISNTFKLNSTVIFNPILKYKKQNPKIKMLKNYGGLKIINIGRLTDQKDQLTLLKSMALILKKSHINFKLVIIGKGKNQTILNRYINENNLTKNVYLLGYKKNAFSYLSLFDLFILSSKYEGLPNALLEAQMSKVPIISSDCPTGPKEILLGGKLGILFKTGDHIDLYKKLLLFVKDKKKYKQKATLAKKYLNRFDYKKNLKKYLKIINKYI